MRDLTGCCRKSRLDSWRYRLENTQKPVCPAAVCFRTRLLLLFCAWPNTIASFHQDGLLSGIYASPLSLPSLWRLVVLVKHLGPHMLLHSKLGAHPESMCLPISLYSQVKRIKRSAKQPYRPE